MGWIAKAEAIVAATAIERQIFFKPNVPSEELSLRGLTETFESAQTWQKSAAPDHGPLQLVTFVTETAVWLGNDEILMRGKISIESVKIRMIFARRVLSCHGSQNRKKFFCEIAIFAVAIVPIQRLLTLIGGKMS